MKRILLISFGVVFFLACSKERCPRVEYRINVGGSAVIAYTMVTPSLREETVSGSWSVSFKHKKGGNVFLSAISSGVGTTKISVYANKKLLFEESTQVPGGLVTISEVLP